MSLPIKFAHHMTDEHKFKCVIGLTKQMAYYKKLAKIVEEIFAKRKDDGKAT